MNFYRITAINQRILLAIASVAALVIIFYIGLKPNGYDGLNHVKWIGDRAGISFDKHAHVFTEPVFDAHSFPGCKEHGMSIEIAIKPDSVPGDNFKFILVMHDGCDGKQLLIGQWRTSLIAINGDDYDGSRRIKNLTCELPPENCLVTITSGKEGTRLYIDGELKKKKKDLRLQWPLSKENATMVLGNSVYGRHSWRGQIYGLSLYDKTLTFEEIHRHYNQWTEKLQFSFVQGDSPRAAYLFNERAGKVAHDLTKNGYDLKLDEEMTILRKEFLVFPSNPNWHQRPFIEDVLVNLLGFIPFGFLLTATFMRFNGLLARYSWQSALLLAFTTSLIIETTQAWIPSRDSNMLDLILNTFGALVGAMLRVVYHKRVIS